MISSIKWEDLAAWGLRSQTAPVFWALYVAQFAILVLDQVLFSGSSKTVRFYRLRFKKLCGKNSLDMLLSFLSYEALVFLWFPSASTL